MFDIGFWELALIGLLALVVLGPKRLPEVARTAGKWVGNIRRFVDNVKRDIDSELNSAELSELRKLKQDLNDTRQSLEQSSSQVLDAFQNEINKLPASGSTAESKSATAKASTSPRRRITKSSRSKATRKPVARKKHGRAKKR